MLHLSGYECLFAPWTYYIAYSSYKAELHSIAFEFCSLTTLNADAINSPAAQKATVNRHRSIARSKVTTLPLRQSVSFRNFVSLLVRIHLIHTMTQKMYPSMQRQTINSDVLWGRLKILFCSDQVSGSRETPNWFENMLCIRCFFNLELHEMKKVLIFLGHFI